MDSLRGLESGKTGMGTGLGQVARRKGQVALGSQVLGQRARHTIRAQPGVCGPGPWRPPCQSSLLGALPLPHPTGTLISGLRHFQSQAPGM